MQIQQSSIIYFLPFIIWDAAWKAVSLWKAARNSQLKWFIAILIINSLGILPIIYIKFFQQKRIK